MTREFKDPGEAPRCARTMAKAKEGDLLHTPRWLLRPFRRQRRRRLISSSGRDESRRVGVDARTCLPRGNARSRGSPASSDFYSAPAGSRARPGLRRSCAMLSHLHPGPRASEEAARPSLRRIGTRRLTEPAPSCDSASGWPRLRLSTLASSHPRRSFSEFANEDGRIARRALPPDPIAAGAVFVGLLRPAPTSPEQRKGGRRLLGGPHRPRVTASEGFQIQPEQTTDAIICHHPGGQVLRGLESRIAPHRTGGLSPGDGLGSGEAPAFGVLLSPAIAALRAGGGRPLPQRITGVIARPGER